MLHSLRVKDLAVVEDARVEFGRGLNVITGETGAGKSIVVGALNLVLGERADKSLIRTGCDGCSVDAVFDLDDPAQVNVLLEKFGVDRCTEGELIIRRAVSASGSARNFINGCSTTLQALRSVGNLLVDMHGPHAHQSLLDVGFQMEILDAFGGLDDRRSAYRRLYDELLELRHGRSELDGDDSQVEQQIDLLRFQIREIEEAELADMDEEELEQEHTVSANAQRILELANGVRNAISDGDAAALGSIAAAIRLLSELADIIPEAQPWKEEVEAASVQLRETSRGIEAYAHRVDLDPERLQWLEDRKALLHKLKRKHGATIAEILGTLDKAGERLRDLETREERIAEIEASIAAKHREVLTAGTALGRKRRTAAGKLVKAITDELRELGFKHGVFSIELETAEPTASGTDSIDFGFAPNPGESSRPLRAIASSGEISRVMLAIKAVLAGHDRIPVLVFDEVDSNLGGEMGNAVGARLATVAASHQVLCITHLPQVAVHGSAHFVVSKEVRGKRTYTEVKAVSGRSRTEEVARMLGGRDMTSVTLKHAQEMLRGGK
jgi:DNA repair protein RecN (Recombination protein N)